jgi:serine/threonine protein kinase
MHKHVVPILGYNLQVDAPFFVMPLAEANLRERLQEIAGKQDRAASIFHQVLDCLEYAHDNGIIHRDLKPENILFFPDVDDWVMIADFGLGKRLDFESLTITRSHESLGTAAYMPPEQCLDLKRVDRRADIFSLGKILYEMLTGDLPIHVLLLLLLDARGPLVVDQPEDDLDNRFITECIVPQLKEQKKRRQFVFSTHNANIPVLGDAELIAGLVPPVTVAGTEVHLPDENLGSIDSTKLCELVEETLEGGREAFELRRLKYGFDTSYSQTCYPAVIGINVIVSLPKMSMTFTATTYRPGLA